MIFSIDKKQYIIAKFLALSKYHLKALSLQVAPDTMATAYALFDRALFTMKVKISHVGVLGMILYFVLAQ